MKRDRFYKGMEPIIKKRARTNALFLAIGTIILLFFLIMLQRGSAERQQKENSNAVLDGVISALDRNDAEVKMITSQFDEMNFAKLKSIKRLFTLGDEGTIMTMSDDERKELMIKQQVSIDSQFLFILDEEGNLETVPDEYYAWFGLNYSGDWNVKALGYFSDEQFDELIKSGGPILAEYNTGRFHAYCVPLGLNNSKGKSLYLLSCDSAEFLGSQTDELTNLSSVLSDVTVGTTGFAFATDPKTGEFLYFDDGTEDLSGSNIYDYGLSESLIKDGYSGTQQIGNENFFCVSRLYPASSYGPEMIITAAESKNEVLSQSGKVIFFALVAFLSVALFVESYALALMSETNRNSKDKESLRKLCSIRGKDYFINRSISKKIIPMAAIGLIVIFLFSMYSETLLLLSRAVTQSIASREQIDSRFDNNLVINEKMKNYYEYQYLSKTKVAASLLEEIPGIAFNYDADDEYTHILVKKTEDGNQEITDEYGNACYSKALSLELKELCSDNDFTSLYVFDENGRTRATSNTDWYFELSDDPEDQSYAFRDVVEGKKDDYVQNVMTSDSGESMQFIAAHFWYYTYLDDNGKTRYASRSEYNRYKEEKKSAEASSSAVGSANSETHPVITKHRGMIEVGISAEKIAKILESTSYEYVLSKMFVMGGGQLIAMNDDEEHTVIYSADKNKIGDPASVFSFEERDFDGSFNGFKTINGEEHFVINRSVANYYIATAIPTSYLYRERNLIALVTTLAGLLVIAGLITMNVVMTEEEWEAVKRLVSHYNSRTYVTKSERLSNGHAVAMSKHRTPEQRLSHMLNGYMIAFAIGLWLYTIIVNNSSHYSLMKYILRLDWEHSPNIISLTACAIIMITVLALVEVLSRLVSMVTKSLGMRSITVGHLLMACIKFIAIAGVIFYCLYLVGFDAKSLLASAGVLSVVLGFGAQTLIGDVLAGIFIVFEGSFRVGDFVLIGDFRGEVLEIGLRTTRIEGDDYNVKIINNSQIADIINLTKENSFAHILVEVSYETDFKSLENDLSESFKLWQKKYHAIVAPPIYKGITSYNASGIEIMIWAPCLEAARPQLERDLREDVINMFNEKGYSVPYQHIVIMK